MARKTAKKSREKAGRRYHFAILCAKNGLIVGAVGPGGKVEGRVASRTDVKLKSGASGVKVAGIKFRQRSRSRARLAAAACVWRLIGGRWRCV